MSFHHKRLLLSEMISVTCTSIQASNVDITLHTCPNLISPPKTKFQLRSQLEGKSYELLDAVAVMNEWIYIDIEYKSA